MFNSLDARRTLGRPDPKRLLARIGMGFITPPTILNINGNNDVDQRNIGASKDFTNSNPLITDRWQCASSTLTTQTVAAQQVASTIPGFAKSLKVTVGGTGASPGSTTTCFIISYLEGLDIASLGWGTASAVPITVSFWVKPSISGRTSFAIRNGASNRSYVAPFDFTAGVSRRIVLKIPGDKTGTWTTDGSIGLTINIDLGIGSNFSTTPGTWQSGNFIGLQNGTKLVATTGATFEITGLTFTPGEIPASPIIRPYSEILDACYRYCYVWRAAGNFDIVCPAICTNQETRGFLQFPKPLRRSADTIGVNSAGNFGFIQMSNFGNTNQQATVTVNPSGPGSSLVVNGAEMSLNTTGISGTLWGWIRAFNSVGATLIFNAE